MAVGDGAARAMVCDSPSGSCPAAQLFYWVGVLAAICVSFRAAYRLLHGARVYLLGHGLEVQERGRWAVVTGSTDGIGKAYAKELANRGMNIVLISRSQEKLDQVASDIKDNFKVEAKTIAVDFGQGVEIYKAIEAGLTGLEIDVLVNNVGISYEYPEYFLDVPDLDDTINKMINVNVMSVCKMTSMVLPGMVERSKGVILNISSASALYPVPLLTLYSATKAFMDLFSRGLHAEYKCKGIIVQSVLPFFVATKLSKIRKPTLDKPSPETYVKAALNTVGLQTQTHGYLPHAIMGWITTSLIPVCLTTKYVMKMNQGLRARYLKRAKQN